MENRVMPAWRRAHSYLLLAALTLVCLVPFCGKAFHMDDTLFLWAAQHIVKQPLDPYGFSIVWYWSVDPMSEVTKNPPLASYYLAAIGKFAGWSEAPLHIAFLLPALIVVLGTYRLALRFTNKPLLAAASTLLTPGFLVSSTNVMSDTAMLAVWMAAALLWLKGLDTGKHRLLAFAGLGIAVCALTKYFGVALIPLLLAYSLVRRRSAGSWGLFLLMPIAILAGYQHWTEGLYGTGLLSQAADYAPDGSRTALDFAAKTIAGFSFAGGCALSALTFIPVIWSRRGILFGALAAGAITGCCQFPALRSALGTPSGWSAPLQLALFISGGISIFALVGSDLKRRRDADSLFLALWVIGTFVFAAFVNWSVNARSLLPMIPAVGILMARRIDSAPLPYRSFRLIAPLAAAGIVSIWVACADTTLANSARDAARYVREHSGVSAANVSFEGHWGFQYYMQSLGFHPVDFATYEVAEGRMVVVPDNNTNLEDVPRQFIESQSPLSFDTNLGLAANNESLGAGFYADVFGPLPFAFGRVPPERYTMVRLQGSGLLDPDAGQ